MSLTRRRFVISSAAAGTALTAAGATPAIFAQDDKPTVKVGSKNFTGQIIVGEMTAILLENSSYPVERQLNLGGTIIAHEALVAGDLDTYIEYSGTGLLAVLGEELPEREVTDASPAASPSSGSGYDPAYEIVAREYPERFGIEWLEPWGFNDTYAILVRRDFSEEHNITKISDLVGMASDLTFVTDPEFSVRPDGLPGLSDTYGFSFGDVRAVDIGLMYSSIANGDADVGSGGTSDGRIPSLDLVVLEDDLNYFPPYFAAPVVRQDLLEEAPEVRDILNQMAGRISDGRIQTLNYEVDENGQEPADVARNFLIDEGLIEG